MSTDHDEHVESTSNTRSFLRRLPHSTNPLCRVCSWQGKPEPGTGSAGFVGSRARYVASVRGFDGVAR